MWFKVCPNDTVCLFAFLENKAKLKKWQIKGTEMVVLFKLCQFEALSVRLLRDQPLRDKQPNRTDRLEPSCACALRVSCQNKRRV